ncbi:hypothetical protein IG631_23881 [Alternaria alternata]|nr:hypothetical protein IG631_23881 [Alternaria alternata]
MITGTPPTISPDATIRASPMLLQDLKSEVTVQALVADAELCLIWYTVSGNPRLLSSACTRARANHLLAW